MSLCTADPLHAWLRQAPPRQKGKSGIAKTNQTSINPVSIPPCYMFVTRMESCSCEGALRPGQDHGAPGGASGPAAAAPLHAAPAPAPRGAVRRVAAFCGRHHCGAG